MGLVTAAALVVVPIAACGGDDEPEATGPTATDAATTDGASTDDTAADGTATTGTTAGPATTTGALADCAEPVVVSIADFAFVPPELRVPAGCEVVWRNDDTQAHTSSGTGAQGWTTGNVAPGETSEPVAFPDAGELPYRCALHPFMTASVVVEG
jgi:plastocyanin